jgi:beta-lactamase superfamily II metal-dependent hydrolase
MIRLTMLPAQDGDCLLLEYGEDAGTRHLLIDGGRAGTYPDIVPTLNALARDNHHLDLLVVTHVDQDHILGVLGLFNDGARPIGFKDVWFNGYDQLVDSEFESFGPIDGELLTTALLNQQIPWNRAFKGKAVELGRPFQWNDDHSSVTLLSPDRAQLQDLIQTWKAECAREGLIPGRNPAEPPPRGFEAFGPIDIEALAESRFEADPSKTNRTSIAFLFECDGVRLMFTGDGADQRLVDSVRPLAEAEGGRLRLDALKVSHHGSRKNLSKDLLDLLDCKRYLISTNGKRHGHPDPVAMARILKYGGPQKELVFNYRSRAAFWNLDGWKDTYQYSVSQPTPDQDGFMILEEW